MVGRRLNNLRLYPPWSADERFNQRVVSTSLGRPAIGGYIAR